MNTWYLVNIVDNDFHQSNDIFELFDGVAVKDMQKPVQAGQPTTNGHTTDHDPVTQGPKINSFPKINGKAGNTITKVEPLPLA